MDKKTFIKELQQALSVLQEDELNDIISEYEQHIDMKMKGGLSEQEAIADFGSLSELSAEILEVYHVRADYADQKTAKQDGGVCRAAAGKAVSELRGIGSWIRHVLSFWKQKIRAGVAAVGGMGGKARMMEREAERPKTDNLRRWSIIPKAIFRWTGRTVHTLAGWTCAGVRLCIRLLAGCGQLAWNVFWIGFSVCCGFCGLLCLFGMGVLLVLWAQHYPLAGVTIGCLGLALCSFSAAGLGMTLLWRRDRGAVMADDKEMSGNVIPSDNETEIEGEQHA